MSSTVCRRTLMAPGQLILLCLGATQTSWAQELRIRVTEPGRPNPAVGILVTLFGSDGTRAAAGVTNDFGRVRLMAPAGAYRARIERPGFLDTTLAVTVSESLDSLTVDHGTGRPTFPDNLVPMSESCPAGGVPVAARPLADEAWRMLRVVAATEDGAATTLSLAQFERILSTSLKKDSEQFTTVLARENRPENALTPGAGYLTPGSDPAWSAPTVAVFLDEAFAKSHCFGVVNGTDARLGLVGLSFVPQDGERVEIEGTMWFDPGGRVLRIIDYRFARIERAWRPDRFGGSLEFHRSELGFWITRFWYQRVPRLQAAGSRLRLRGYRELGAEVMSLTATIDTTDRIVTSLAIARQRQQGALLVASLAGTVLDTLGYPVDEAEVVVMGTEYQTKSDRDGRFVMKGLPLGSQIVQVRKVGYKAQYFVIRLAGGQEWNGKVAIAKLPQTLGEIVVVGKWGKPAQYASTSKYDDFYRRRAARSGRFLTREEIDKQAVGRISDLLKTVPGVRVAFTAPGQAEDISFLTCPGFNVGVWIDGQKMTGTVQEILPLITPSDIEALEVYQRQSAVPPEFRDNSCAAIVMWTRFGGR